jgi:hypothetical protein
LVKLRCERLAARLVAETGSDAALDVHFKDVCVMGSYGAVLADVRDFVVCPCYACSRSLTPSPRCLRGIIFE